MNRRTAGLFVLFLAACGGNVVVDAARASSSSGSSSSVSSGTFGVGAANPSSSTITPAGGLGGQQGFGGNQGFGGGIISPVTVASGGPGGCVTEPPPNSLSLCGGSATSGTSGGATCDFSFCQEGSKNTWGASCQGNTCTLNRVTLCMCTVSDSDICASGRNGCCFNQ